MSRAACHGGGLFAPLDRKVVRDLARTWAQGLAIALVMACGVALFVLSTGMLRSLEESRAAYYDRYRFADVFAAVKRAPNVLVEDMQEIPGVSVAEGRVSAPVLLDVPDYAEPVRGQAISLPDIGEPALNHVFLRSGRMLEPRREDEILLAENFADAHGLSPGDTLAATMNGAKRSFRIVGIVLSPEFIYTIAPGEIVPDDKRFGVIWMGREALGNAFDLDGAFNSVLLALGRNANEREVIDRLDRLLDPYGATGAFGRDDQPSHQFVSSELEQMQTMGFVMPPIFLAVAAFLLNVVVSRLIEIEREQIGLLKAFGYSDWAVSMHYVKYVLVMALAGAAVGCGLGAWLGRGMALLYLEYFAFPVFVFDTSPDIFATAVLVAVVAMGAGVFFAVRRAAALAPADAMRPPAPKDYSGVGSPPAWFKRLLDQPTRMILRRIMREPLRSLLSVLGIAAAASVLVLGRFNMDAVPVMLDISFNVAERQHMTVTFVEPRSMRAYHEVSGLDGVLRSEPFRAVPVRLRNGVIERREGVTGLVPGADLSRPIGADLEALSLPPNGLLMSVTLAELLKVEPGDTLEMDVLEGRQPRVTVLVSGVAETFLGSPIYMELSLLNDVLGEGPQISGVHMTVDAAKREEIYAIIKDMPQVAGVSLLDESRRSFEKLLADNVGTFTLINFIFAALIAVGVVYNTARIALSERAWELASLRVFGFTKGETAYVLLGELALLTLVAIPIGCGLGYLFCWYLVESFSNEIYRVPLVVTNLTYGYAVVIVGLATFASSWLVWRDIRNLNLISVLKTRE